MDARTLCLNGPLPVFRLGGKVALITGGGGKIGQETARRLLREGANVSLVDVNVEALQSTVNVVKETLATGQPVQSRIITIVADVTVESEVRGCIKRTVAAFRRLDCAFLNAATDFQTKSIFDTTEEDYERIMRLNVKAAFLGLKHVATTMRELGNGGSIILTSSTGALVGVTGHILESSSKSALNGLAITAASELGQFGIRVNTIHPSGLGSTILKRVESTQELEELKHAIPLGRFAQVDDVASVVAFLASEDSKFMTGGDLRIDGGCITS